MFDGGFIIGEQGIWVQVLKFNFFKLSSQVSVEDFNFAVVF
jgi:hypothetical protein